MATGEPRVSPARTPLSHSIAVPLDLHPGAAAVAHHPAGELAVHPLGARPAARRAAPRRWRPGPCRGILPPSETADATSHLPITGEPDRTSGSRGSVQPAAAAVARSALAVVDDPRRDQDNQVAPMLLVGGEPEQLADDREIDQERNARLGSGRSSVTVRPPMTAVSPSATRSWLSAFCFRMVKPRSAAARAGCPTARRATFISTWRLLVTCGVTVSLIPVSLKCTVALGGPGCRSSRARRRSRGPGRLHPR